MISRRRFVQGTAGLFVPAMPALILPCEALAQVGQIPGWPPTQVVASGSAPVLLVSASGASSDGSGADTSATPIDTTGANLLVVVVSDFAGGGSHTVSDNKSNTWTPLTSATNSTSRTTIFYSVPTSVGSGHTFQVSGSGLFPCIFVAAFSGANATPFDVQNTGTGTSSTAAAGSITPTQNNELVIAGATISSGSISSIDSSFSILASFPNAGGTHVGGGLAYKTQSGAAADNPNWTLSGSFDWSASIASFKAP